MIKKRRRDADAIRVDDDDDGGDAGEDDRNDNGDGDKMQCHDDADDADEEEEEEEEAEDDEGVEDNDEERLVQQDGNKVKMTVLAWKEVKTLLQKFTTKKPPSMPFAMPEEEDNTVAMTKTTVTTHARADGERDDDEGGRSAS